MDDQDLQQRFTDHGTLLAQAARLGELIDSLCPDGVEKRVASDRLLESMVWAGAAFGARRVPAGG